jgi:hypothetical protein
MSTTTKKDITFWVKPSQTIKNDEDRLEEMWCSPCLQKLKKGSCGPQMVAAFSCFYLSKNRDGAECLEKFAGMRECVTANPVEYAEYLQ